MTYRIELFTLTSKGKTNHIDDVFISTDASKEDVAKHYQEKYKPISVSVAEVEVVDIPSADKEKAEIGVVKTNGGNLYSDPEYRISRESLPKEVKELLDHLDELGKDVSDTTKKINGLMFPYFSSGGAMSSYSKDSITCRGYIRPLALNLRKVENE